MTHSLTHPAVPKPVGGAMPGWSNVGGFNHTVVQVLLTGLGPILESGEVLRGGWPLQPLTFYEIEWVPMRLCHT